MSLLAGEAGIGKTMLAGAFAVEVRAAGALVLYGRCESEPLLNYQPFVEALRQLLAQRSQLAERLRRRFEPEFAELSRLVPELRDLGLEAPSHDTSGERYRLFEAVVALLAGAAATQPVLLVLDDLHWADKPTALLLSYLVRPRGGVQLMVLGTARDGLEMAPHVRAVLADLRRGPALQQRVELHGLDVAETREFAKARGAPDAGERFVDLLRARTGGNPFFIEATLHDLGADEREESMTGVPVSAREIIDHRLAPLAPATVDVLVDAATCGPEFQLPVLAELRGVHPSALEPHLATSIEAGLVERLPDGFGFCHALVRDALYSRAGMDHTLALRHLRVGQALERLQLRPALAELANHFHKALLAGGAAKAARYARGAADLAARSLAYEEAERHLLNASEALALLDSGYDAERWAVLQAHGHLKWRIGDRTDAQRMFDEACELARCLNDPKRLARSALGYACRWYDAEQPDPRTVRLLEEALAALPEREREIRAQLMAALVDVLQFSDSRERLDALSSEAVRIADDAGDWALARVLGARHTAILHINHLVERLALSARWRELARCAGHREGEGFALTWRIYDLVEFGDVRGARKLHMQLSELAEELRQPLYHAFAAAWDCNWHALAGEFDAAERAARACWEHSRSAQGTFAASLYGGQRFGLYRDLGRLCELPALVRDLGEDRTLPIWRAGFILCEAESADKPAARSELAALAEDDFAAIPADGFWLAAICILSEACAHVGDAAIAAQLAAKLEPHATRHAQIGLAAYLGPVHYFLGQLAVARDEPAAAVTHFESALERANAAAARVAEARVQRDLGAVLITQSSAKARARGEELRERAHATATRLGAKALLTEAATIARLTSTAARR